MLSKEIMVNRLLLFLFLFPVILAGCGSRMAEEQALNRYEFESRHMGTLFRIILYAPDESTAEAASDSAFGRIEVLNDLLSDYKEDSELNKVSAASGTEKFIPVSSPLFYVVKRAQEVARLTGGAFDITVGPYVELWRAMNRKANPHLPGKKRLNKASQSVGYQYINMDSLTHSIALLKPEMQLDLGGIAKGYAADEALEVLQAFGIRTALVDGGGDISLGDAPPGKEGWTVSIPILDEKEEPKYITLLLSNKAVATSGDFFQYVEIDGQRYSHIINPRTGLGLTHQIMVTVVAPDGTTADSHASAVSVLGASEGMRFIESRPGVSALIQYEEDGVLKVKESSGFGELRRVAR